MKLGALAVALGMGAALLAAACSSASHGFGRSTDDGGITLPPLIALPAPPDASAEAGNRGSASSVSQSSSSSATVDDGSSEWLDPMNAARAAVGESPLVWDPIAAKVALAWANMCTFEHNPNAGADYARLGGGSGGLGENIAAGTTPESPATACADWIAEKADYHYATNTCSADCGHYTQIVWATTTAVGCAHVTCTQGSPFGGGDWDFSVCDFSPPGNYIGKKPY